MRELSAPILLFVSAVSFERSRLLEVDELPASAKETNKKGIFRQAVYTVGRYGELFFRNELIGFNDATSELQRMDTSISEHTSQVYVGLLKLRRA